MTWISFPNLLILIVLYYAFFYLPFFWGREVLIFFGSKHSPQNDELEETDYTGIPVVVLENIGSSSKNTPNNLELVEDNEISYSNQWKLDFDQAINLDDEANVLLDTSFTPEIEESPGILPEIYESPEGNTNLSQTEPEQNKSENMKKPSVGKNSKKTKKAVEPVKPAAAQHPNKVAGIPIGRPNPNGDRGKESDDSNDEFKVDIPVIED